MGKFRYLSMQRLNETIAKMLLNKFDSFMIIEGNRGLGKSTLAFHILKKQNNIFKFIGKEIPELAGRYEFRPTQQLKYPEKFRSVIYKQEDVINFYNKWYQSAIADEMINVAFNREFWSENQKNLIKMINMNRDHCNLLIACVPQFQVLDNQIKNLCKIRITVVRRGLAVVQTPNRTIYNSDRWDSANNEKIEREWLKRGTGLPQYSKLNTFRGMLKFPPLSPKEQKIYDAIKNQERNVIAKDLGVTDGKAKKKSVFEDTVEKLLAGRIRNAHVLEGLAYAEGTTPDAFRTKIRRELIKRGKAPLVAEYFWDKKAKKDEIRDKLKPISD